MDQRTLVERNRLLTLSLAGVVLAGFALYVAHVLFGLGGSGTVDWIDHFLYLGIMVGCAALCFVRAASVREQRLAWALIGGGILVFAAGDLYWTQVLADRSGQATFPSPADIGYLGFYPLVLAGAVLVVVDRLRARAAGLWLDATAVAFAIAAIGSAIVLETVSDGLGNDLGALAEGLSYPVADLLLLAFLGAILVVSGQRPGASVALLTAGLATLAVADAAYSYELASGTYTETSALNVLWPLAALFVGAAAWMPIAEPVTVRPRRGWRMLFVAGVVGLATCAGYAYERLSGGDPLTEGLLLATMIAVLVRLTFAFAENQRLIARVSHDSLTGLGNRGRLELDLREAIWKSRRPSVLALLDLDGFKRYNDTYGHPAGDALLSRLAERLQSSIEGAGQAYRVGGDEFCVLIGGDIEGTTATLADALDAFSERGHGFEISSSIGTVELPREAPSPEAAIGLADRRMYESKASSRVGAPEQAAAVLARAQRERTPELSSHTRDVAELATAVGRHLGLGSDQLALLARAAELHDIGKVAIPDAILDKPSGLNETERAFVRRHSVVGERILASAPDLLPVARIVRSSHERFDGSGYPDGLEGDQIPIAARIIFVCDAFSAMTTPRPYSQAMTPREALLELRRCSSTQFDPVVVGAFGQSLAAGGPELAADDRPRSERRSLSGWLVPRAYGSANEG